MKKIICFLLICFSVDMLQAEYVALDSLRLTENFTFKQKAILHKVKVPNAVVDSTTVVEFVHNGTLYIMSSVFIQDYNEYMREFPDVPSLIQKIMSICPTECRNGDCGYSFTFYYTYDLQNRLVESQRDHRGQKRPCEWFQYDSRGNITALQRYDVARLIDNLTLTYQKEGNQLLSVKDDETDSYKYEVIEYIDRHEATTDEPDMQYDANGNLISDADRGISVIHYNILNLPDTIQFVNGNQIVNLYDATGHKSKTIVYTVPQTTVVPQYEIAQYSFEVDTIAYLVTAYDNNIETIYTRDDTLVRRINNGIGYSVANTYFHHHKDHLGNINVVVDSEADTLVQSTIYYASGVPMAQSFGRDKQPYLYNGKEFIEAHGLNEYDSQARMYYSSVMRTTTMDPMAEKYYHISPYAWCGNNPIAFVDPDGRAWYLPSGYPAPNTADAQKISEQELPLQWTDCKSQEEMDEAGVKGTYYGEAVVVFNGYKDEHFGTKNGKGKYLEGDDAKLADVTLYGPSGADDITTGLRGFTMTSNYDLYGAIDDGIYWGNYDKRGKGGSIPSHWVLNNRGRIPQYDYQPNFSPYADYLFGTMYKDGIFIHSTLTSDNRVGKRTSVGCLLLDWNSMRIFNEKMSGVSHFTVQITRH